MTTFNINTQVEQEQRIKHDNCALESEIDSQTKLYFHGEFDGVTGLLEPEYPFDQNYWAGYCEGLKRYWMNKKPLKEVTSF